jgi:hypothetical protein
LSGTAQVSIVNNHRTLGAAAEIEKAPAVPFGLAAVHDALVAIDAVAGDAARVRQLVLLALQALGGRGTAGRPAC